MKLPPWPRGLDRDTPSRRFLAPRPCERCEPRTLLAPLIYGPTLRPSATNGPDPFLLSIDSVSVNRGTAGTTAAVFTVSLVPPNFEQVVTVDYSTADGSAKAGVDYLPVHGTLTFNPDDFAEPITVPVLGSPVYQADKTFTVTLSNPTPAATTGIDPAAGVGTGTILDAAPEPSASIDDAFVIADPAGTTAAVFTVTLSGPSDFVTGVPFATADGTARAGVNYTATAGVLDFPAGVTSETILVPVRTGTDVEPNRTFFVNLGTPTHATLGRAQGVGTIITANVGGTLQFSSPTYSVRGDAASATITVTRTGGAASGVTIPYATVPGGTAVAGRDYRPAAGRIAFGAGQKTATFAVPILPNLLLGPDTTVDLMLGAATGGGMLGMPARAVLTIRNENSLVVTNARESGPGSLRRAINTSNANPALAPNQVTFAIPGAGVHFIAPASPLPSLVVPATIDARTQPGFAGTPLVALDGAAAGATTDGLTLLAGRSAIRGLAIDRFGGAGIVLRGRGGDTVAGDFLGADPTGGQAAGNGQDGVLVDGVAGNTIGGAGIGARNLISGNGIVGVRLRGAGATRNVIQGNKIGTDLAGARPLGNASDGVFLDGAAGNTIGGTTPAAGNLISGNGAVGVQLLGPASTRNVILGNRIGTNLAGTGPLGNAYDGVYLNGAPGNTVGGGASGARNVISGNAAAGVQITGASATRNLVQGNAIGTDLAGLVRVGNGQDGVFLEGAPGNVIGGLGATMGNVISGNGLVGVRAQGAGASGNLILGDLIGTDATGSRALGNAADGIFLNDAPGNTVGGTAPGSRVVISGNGSVGVQVFGAGASGNLVQGSFVGTDVTGTFALGNGRDGVYVNQAPGNVIGGPGPGAGNLISGNGSAGVQFFGPGAAGNTLLGDRIGTDAAGRPALGNRYGLFLNRARGNAVAGNLIAGNAVANIVRET